MGGILYSTVEQEIIQSLKKDNSKKLKDILIKYNSNPDTLYTKRKRTLIQLSCYFLSPKCLSTLIELNYDYNKKETFNQYTPLYIACKFNSLPIVKILLSHDDCEILQKTTDNFNEFEIAFLKGNYDICYYLLYEYKNEENKENINNNDNKEENIKNENNIENDINTKSELKIPKKNKNAKLKKEKPLLTDQPYQKFFLSKDFDLDNCKSLQEQNLFPLFNMQLLYQSLLDRVPPKKCPSFAAERKRTKELMNKIPDPNETWGHFFKRLVNFELYNPPLVDKRNVSQMNSMYMNAQMKLMESEYGIKMSYYDNEGENLDDSKQVGESEEQPILQLKKNKKVEKQKEEEEEPENIIKINVKSVSKTESKNNGNSSVRDKDDFYTVDINNTSGRQINENEKGDDISDKQ
jgi:hypothetical protein